MTSINKGVELMLRRKRRKAPEPQSCFIKFGKVVTFFRKEITIYFELSFDVKDKRRGEKKWN